MVTVMRIQMKIAVISPNADSLQEMGRILNGQSRTVALVEGGKDRMRAVADQEKPHLMILESVCPDTSELTEVERVTTQFPDMAVVLLCGNHTPDFLLNAMRAGVREILQAPINASALEAAVNRMASKMQGAQVKTAGKVLAFVSCKGGSGSTFLATNFGYQLAEEKSVLLVDLNLQFGDALTFVHDGKPGSTVADVAQRIGRLDATLLAASTVQVAQNYHILAAPDDPAQAMEIQPSHIDAIINLAVTRYDFVLLDVSRNLDPVAIKAFDRAYRIFPVLQAGLPYLRNAAKLLAVFKSLGYSDEKTELIVNRFEKGSEIGLNDIRRLLGAARMHTVSNSFKEVNASINHGNPLAEMARSNAVAKTLAEFVHTLNPRPEESRGLFDRLFRRA